MQQETDILIMMLVTSAMMLLLSGFFVYVVIVYQRRVRNKQLEQFNMVMEAQEAEQGRIARDLHDHLGPTLSVIKMQMDAISNDGLNEMDVQMKHDIDSQMEHEHYVPVVAETKAAEEMLLKMRVEVKSIMTWATVQLSSIVMMNPRIKALKIFPMST